MSTRGLYTFKDEYHSITVYVHFDNYPTGAVQKIEDALKYAWKLPRFEADEFAAAFVAANKTGGGDVRLTNNATDMGQDYHYFITCVNGKIWVKFGDFEGTLETMKLWDEPDDE